MDALAPGEWIVNNYKGKNNSFKPAKFVALLNSHEQEDILILLRNGKHIDATIDWYDFCMDENLPDDIMRYKYCPRELHKQEVEKYHRLSPTQEEINRRKLQKAIPLFGVF